MRSDLVTQSVLLLLLVIVCLACIMLTRPTLAQVTDLRDGLPRAPIGDLDLTITHEHVCHIEKTYIDTTVPYPPTVYEATCDGAVIKLYED